MLLERMQEERMQEERMQEERTGIFLERMTAEGSVLGPGQGKGVRVRQHKPEDCSECKFRTR